MRKYSIYRQPDTLLQASIQLVQWFPDIIFSYLSSALGDKWPNNTLSGQVKWLALLLTLVRSPVKWCCCTTRPGAGDEVASKLVEKSLWCYCKSRRSASCCFSSTDRWLVEVIGNVLQSCSFNQVTFVSSWLLELFWWMLRSRKETLAEDGWTIKAGEPKCLCRMVKRCRGSVSTCLFDLCVHAPRKDACITLKMDRITVGRTGGRLQANKGAANGAC